MCADKVLNKKGEKQYFCTSLTRNAEGVKHRFKTAKGSIKMKAEQTSGNVTQWKGTVYNKWQATRFCT